jgi:DNA polymerase-3 subunit chi
MTEVEFHFNVGDKLTYSCRLLRKARAGGAQIMVTAEPNLLAQLDQMLWTFSSTEFLPHCRSDADPATVAITPILLATTLTDPAFEGSPHGVLVNLGQSVPEGFERFERFIELVGSAEDDRLSARHRWKHYKDRGYALKKFDLSSAVESV